MSTNYYAKLNLASNKSIETVVKIHIGKTSSSAGFSGDWFASFADWKKFLSFNEDKLSIEDEYGRSLSLEELVAIFEGYSPEKRRAQYDVIAEQYPELLSEYWVDEDGFTFSKGDFF